MQSRPTRLIPVAQPGQSSPSMPAPWPNGSGQGTAALSWLWWAEVQGPAAHLPRELPGSWPLYLELVSSVAAISLSLWACWACVVPLGEFLVQEVSPGKGLRTLPQFWASLY